MRFAFYIGHHDKKNRPIIEMFNPYVFSKLHSHWITMNNHGMYNQGLMTNVIWLYIQRRCWNADHRLPTFENQNA